MPPPIPVGFPTRKELYRLCGCHFPSVGLRNALRRNAPEHSCISSYESRYRIGGIRWKNLRIPQTAVPDFATEVLAGLPVWVRPS